MIVCNLIVVMLLGIVIPINATTAETVPSEKLLIFDPTFVKDAEIVREENSIQLTRTQKLNTRSMNEQYRKDVVQLFTSSEEDANLWMTWLNSDQGSKSSPRENDSAVTIAAQFTLYYEKETTILSEEYVTLTDIEGYIDILSNQVQITGHSVTVEVDDKLSGEPLFPYTWSRSISVEDYDGWSIQYTGTEDRLKDVDGLGFSATYEITIFRRQLGLEDEGRTWTLEIANRLSLPVD